MIEATRRICLWGNSMPDIYVNLDALITREDFEAKSDQNLSANLSTTQTITELEKGKFFFSVLKKPDFQRETANWTPETAAELIKSFVDEDLVPAIILWRSPSNDIFVIDGSHRLSALIGWVHDDYGDKDISKKFFDSVISDAQIEAAETTRKIINKTVGAYAELQFAIGNPGKAKTEHIERAKKLGSLAINVQWVTGDARKAEHSFFRINQQGTPIDPTELTMLRARRSPSALAARAIIRAGVGHKYWSKFSADTQVSIEAEAKNVYKNLFEPQLETPIKTMDIPIAGRAYSAKTLPLIFDLVNLANDQVFGRAPKVVAEDIDGTKTVEFLRNVRKVAYRISGEHASSLGMHPIVYFYGSTGRFQPTSFFGVVALMKELEKTNRFTDFTKVRRKFEDFLLSHKHLSNQITQKVGSGLKGYTHVLNLYKLVIAGLDAGLSEQEIEQSISSDPKLSFLRTASDEDERQHRKDFSTDTKSGTFLVEGVRSLIECKICRAYMHRNSITFDHIQDKRLGGTGDSENAQIAHPYCNSTYKDWLRANGVVM
jgi:hypothetical protein